MADTDKTAQTMLYRAREDATAKNDHAWNLPLDTKIVDDDQIAAHQKDGWQTAAEVHAPKKAATKGA